MTHVYKNQLTFLKLQMFMELEAKGCTTKWREESEKRNTNIRIKTDMKLATLQYQRKSTEC